MTRGAFGSITTMAGPGKKRNKFAKVMGEFKRGTLKSGSGKKVTKRSQTKAIASSEQRQAKKGKRKKR